MSEEPRVEYRLMESATLLEFDVVETRIEPTAGNEDYAVTIVMRTDDEIFDTCAMGFMFALGVLSFHDARPRGVSGQWFEDEDEFRLADMMGLLEYRNGVLYLYVDYLRGRCLKTTVEIHPDGRMVLSTVNRGQAATRWVDRLKGKKTLQAV